MKKGILIISEKHERITIRHKRKRSTSKTICGTSEKNFKSLNFDSASRPDNKTKQTTYSEIREAILLFWQKSKMDIFVCLSSVFRK